MKNFDQYFSVFVFGLAFFAMGWAAGLVDGTVFFLTFCS